MRSGFLQAIGSIPGNASLPPAATDEAIAGMLRRTSRIGAALLVALGAAVLVGWALELEWLKRMHTTYATMKPNAALLFMMLGTAMWRARAPNDAVTRWLAVAIVVIAGATTAEYTLGIDLHIDGLLFEDHSAPTPWQVPGRMSPITAVCFVLIAIAVLLLDSRRFVHVSQVLACCVLVASILAGTGMLYDAQTMFAVGPYTTMAVHTIVGGLVGSLTVLTSRTNRGVMAILTSETGAGTLLRRLTPAIALAPVMFAWLGVQAEARGVIDPAFSAALLATLTVVILFAATAIIARSLHRSEVVRDYVQDQLLERERELAESEFKYRDLYENAPDMYGSVRTADGIVVDCNQTLLDALGRDRREVVGRHVFELYDPACLDRVSATFETFRAVGSVTDVELSLRRADGTTLETSLSATAVRDEEGRIIRSRAVWRDIAGRRQLQELRERDRFFQVSLDMVGIANADGYFLQISPAFCHVLGYTNDELLSVPYIEFVHPADRVATIQEASRAAQGERTLRFTNRYRCKDGSYRWLQWRAQPDESGLIYAIARDITEDIRASQELQRSEESLRASLREREVLLQEVHHRVKNNLQVISSLISMQLRQLGDHGGQAALRDCQNRIQSIALIHEKLYQSDDYARVPFSDYAAGLVASIFEATGATGRGISLETDADHISLPVDKAIPCGLILNELVSNSLKHAFAGRPAGQVRVELHAGPARHIILSVADDGVGVAAGFDPRQASSLGMQLVCTLVEQLRGRLEVERGVGTTFRVRFPGEGRL